MKTSPFRTHLVHKKSQSLNQFQACGSYFGRPGDTRWNSEYDATVELQKKLEKSNDNLNTLMQKLNVPKFSKDEIEFCKEYLLVMKPISCALDYIQGDNTFLGDILPMVIKIRSKISSEEANFKFCNPLSNAVLNGLDKRFQHLFQDKHHILASLTHPKYKTHWIKDQNDKEDHIKLLRAEVAAMTKQNPKEKYNEKDNDVEKGNDFMYFEDDENSYEVDEVQLYLKCQQRDLMSLKQFPTIEKIFRKYNTILPSSAAVERLFSQGKIIFGNKRHKLHDSSAEKQLMLKVNQKFY